MLIPRRPRRRRAGRKSQLESTVNNALLEVDRKLSELQDTEDVKARVRGDTFGGELPGLIRSIKEECEAGLAEAVLPLLPPRGADGGAGGLNAAAVLSPVDSGDYSISCAGVMDDAEVFLDHLVLPRGIAPAFDGLLVIEPPNLVYCRDLDGDGLVSGGDLGLLLVAWGGCP